MCDILYHTRVAPHKDPRGLIPYMFHRWTCIHLHMTEDRDSCVKLYFFQKNDIFFFNK